MGALTIGGGRSISLNSSMSSLPTYPICMHLLPKRPKPSLKEWIKQVKYFSCKGENNLEISLG